MTTLPCREMDRLTREITEAVRVRDEFVRWAPDGREPIRANAEVLRLEECVAAHRLNCKVCRVAA